MLKRKLWSFVFLVGMLWPLALCAEEKVLSAQENEKTATEEAEVYVEIGPKIAPAERLSKAFYKSLNHVFSGRIAQASEELAMLKERSESLGYKGLPDFSIELLNHARSALDSGKREEASFLVRKAVLLSPKDTRVALIAASFDELVGNKKALESVWTVFTALLDYPLSLVSVSLSLFLIGLVSCTISFLIVCVVQLLRGGEQVFEMFRSFIPHSINAIMALFCLVAVLILPLFGGILCALAVWALTLSFSKKRCSNLGIFAGLIVLLWGLVIPLFSTLGYNIELESNRVLDDINNFSFSPKGEQLLIRKLMQSPSDPILLFTLGQVYQLKGFNDEATSAYQRALRVNKNGELSNLTKMNLAGVEYSKGEYSKAKDGYLALEKTGYQTFELYYNLSATYLALVDTEAHRKYYALARGSDASRLAALENLHEEHLKVLITRLPISLYLPLLNRSIASTNSVHSKEALALRQQLSSALFSGIASSEVLTGLGLLVIVLGCIGRGFVRKRGQQFDRFRFNEISKSSEKGSHVWMLLPAGPFLAGERPVTGGLVLAVFLALVMFAFEAPVRFFGPLPVNVPFHSGFLWLAMGFLVISAVLSLLFRGRNVQC